MCSACVHYREDDDGQPYCDAFGGPPPDEILMDGYDHRQPYPGDNGVQFEPTGPVDVEWLESFEGQERGVSVNDGLPSPPDEPDQSVQY